MRTIKFRQPVFIGGKFDRWHFWGMISEGEFHGPLECGKNSQQFTGLLDKNGKEIYEGDLLENIGGIPGLVNWKYGVFYVGEYRCLLNDYCGNEKLIIGNIYENPSLLSNK